MDMQDFIHTRRFNVCFTINEMRDVPFDGRKLPQMYGTSYHQLQTYWSRYYRSPYYY